MHETMGPEAEKLMDWCASIMQNTPSMMNGGMWCLYSLENLCMRFSRALGDVVMFVGVLPRRGTSVHEKAHLGAYTRIQSETG